VVHAGKLGQVNNFNTVGGTAKHSIDQCCYCLLGGDTAMPGGLHTSLCHAFLVLLNLTVCDDSALW